MHLKTKKSFFIFMSSMIFIVVTWNPLECGAWGGKGKGRGGGEKIMKITTESRQEQIARGLVKTGLQPIYPEGVKIRKVASFFADQTRYDGSSRTKMSNHGYHGGMDISAIIGTPIVAVADGTVIQVASAGRLVGNKIMLQHAPEDTGLDVWLYTKYQHFDELPTLEEGERVKMGQIIGKAGKTGTTGGHFGTMGYPHLHMNAYISDSNKYRVKEGDHKLKVKDSKYIDPLALFFGKELDSHKIKALPDDEKKFDVPFITNAGKIVPSDTKFVWPFIAEIKL